MLATVNGAPVALGRIAEIKITWEPATMWRENREYAITVQGDVIPGIQGPTATAALMKQFQVQQQFFPDSSRPEILVDIYLSEGIDSWEGGEGRAGTNREQRRRRNTLL